MDDLARITADDQAEAERRERTKAAQAFAGDVSAYYAALPDTMSDELRDSLTADFGAKWHSCYLDDGEMQLSLLYQGDSDDV